LEVELCNGKGFSKAAEIVFLNPTFFFILQCNITKFHISLKLNNVLKRALEVSSFDFYPTIRHSSHPNCCLPFPLSPLCGKTLVGSDKGDLSWKVSWELGRQRENKVEWRPSKATKQRSPCVFLFAISHTHSHQGLAGCGLGQSLPYVNGRVKWAMAMGIEWGNISPVQSQPSDNSSAPTPQYNRPTPSHSHCFALASHWWSALLLPSSPTNQPTP